VAGLSCQQGATLLFAPQYGTVFSIEPPLPSDRWLTTVQSGSDVPGLLAIAWVMHGGSKVLLIRSAILSSDGAKVSSQIDRTRPPNSPTNCATRTPGSATLPMAGPAVAVH